MNEFFILLLSLAAGISLGIFYFGGLWLTLNRISHARQPVLLILGSFFGRLGFCLFGFYLVLRAAHLEGLASSLAGFILMKFVLVHRLGKSKNDPVKVE